MNIARNVQLCQRSYINICLEWTPAAFSFMQILEYYINSFCQVVHIKVGFDFWMLLITRSAKGIKAQNSERMNWGRQTIASYTISFSAESNFLVLLHTVPSVSFSRESMFKQRYNEHGPQQILYFISPTLPPQHCAVFVHALDYCRDCLYGHGSEQD